MKTTTTLNHEGISYTNPAGKTVKADFREVDAKETFLKLMSSNTLATQSEGKARRVYRSSILGKKLLARFYDGTDQENQEAAEAFAGMMNANYKPFGFYTAIIK